MGSSAPEALAPPDGGYGWVIVFAVLLQLMLAGPIMPMFGIIFGPMFAEFETTPSEQTSIFAIYLVSWNLITLFVGPLTELRSERFVALCSTTLIVGGLVLCAFATSTYDFMICYGLLVGCGIGLGNANGIFIINKYFKNRVGAAFGLMATGLAISSQVCPQIVKVLITHLTGRQTILVYASLCCASYIGALLMRDVRPLLRPLEGRDLEEHQARLLAFPPPEKEELPTKGFCANFIIFRVFRMINWRLLCDPNFILIALGNSIAFTCNLSYIPMLREICKERHLDLGQTANLLTILGVMEMIGRPFWGFLGDSALLRRLTFTPKKLVYTVCGLSISLGYVAITFTDSFPSLALTACFLSLCGSGMMVNSALVFAESFGHNLPSAIGLSNLSRAAVAILIGPLIGLLKENYGSFNIALYFMAGLTAAGMLAWILAGCFCHLDKRPQKARDPEKETKPQSS